MTVHELRAGAELLPVGQRRFSLEKWIATFVMKRFEGQILPVTVEIADLAAVRTIAAKSRGHNIELADALIAATAEVHNLQVVTLNRRHLQPLGVRLVNWSDVRSEEPAKPALKCPQGFPRLPSRSCFTEQRSRRRAGVGASRGAGVVSWPVWLTH